MHLIFIQTGATGSSDLPLECSLLLFFFFLLIQRPYGSHGCSMEAVILNNFVEFYSALGPHGTESCPICSGTVHDEKKKKKDKTIIKQGELLACSRKTNFLVYALD